MLAWSWPLKTEKLKLFSGGAGRIRTADKQFRKLLLYPSELQPHVSIVILLARFCFLWVRHGDGRGAPGVVAAALDFDPGAIFVIRKLRKMIGQYSFSALLAAFSPTRIP